MKRLTAIILSMLLLFPLASCSAESPNESSGESTSTTIETNEHIDANAPTKQSIYDSVSSLISDDLLYNEEQYSTYNSTDGKTFFFFQFRLFGSENRLVYLLKSRDGGKTWDAQDIQGVPSMGSREHVACAEMLNESVGLISGKYWADANFSDHTYITVDGGKNWTKVVLPKDAPYVYSEDSSNTVTYFEGEAYDLTQENGVYFLHVRAYTFDPNSDTGYELLRFSSTDLASWTYVETKN